MKNKKNTITFRFLSFLVGVFIARKHQFIISEEISEDAIIVGNHAQLYGPICMQLYFPYKRNIWSLSEVFDRKLFKTYAMKEFWPNKKHKKFYKFLSVLLAPLAEYIFKHADTIPVYKDQRLITTMRETIKSIQDGNKIIIFPECHEKYNNVVNEFQQNYVDLARLYYAKTKKIIKFYPMYTAPKLRKVLIGKPISYDIDKSPEDNRKIINDYLKNEITKLANSLPKHIIIPYDNIRKKDYPTT